MQATCKVYLDAANSDAGLTEYFWIFCCDLGMDLLARASMEGSVEAGYLCAMLLLCDHKDEVQRDVEMFEVIRTYGEVERCREVFRDIF
ncbi:hypothetical protein AHAS_Ahas15G0165800 [Arachis hypogaea]